MTNITPRLLLAAALTMLVLTVAPAASSRIVTKYDPRRGLDDLMLFGFGEVTFHAMSVKGNSSAFEQSNPALKDGFAANYRSSLFANGNLGSHLFLNGTAVVDSRINDEYRTVDPSVFRLRMSVESREPLWGGWRFTGTTNYDPQRQWDFENLDMRLLTQPQREARLELLAKLESDKHGYVEGGSLHPSFRNSSFTLHQRSLFGAFADLHAGPVGAEAVAGKLEGRTVREGSSVGILANGTTGPYDLSNAPVTRGSETVSIEVRDRFDHTTVISTRALQRDIDYTVDYDRGRILLHQPVSSETVAEDPVYIVITYDYQRTENDDLFGSRVRVMPVDGAEAGVSFLHRNIDPGAVGGDGEAEPEDLRSADLSFTNDRYGNGYFEMAGNNNADQTADHAAYRAGYSNRLMDRLDVTAGFQRIDDQFRSFTNTDLDPNKNQQRFDVGGNFDLTERQQVSAAYRNLRGLAENGQYNPYAGLRDEKVYGFGYRNRVSRGLNLSTRVERRDVHDRADTNHENNRRNRLILDLNGNRDNTGLLGTFGYGLYFENIKFCNYTAGGDPDNTTNQLALTISSAPNTNTSVELTQKIRVQKNSDTDSYDEREDGTFARVHLRPYGDFSVLGTAEYKRFTVPGNGLNLWQDDPTRSDWAGTLALEYLPLEKLKALGQIGRYRTKDFFDDSTSVRTDDHLLGQVTYFHSNHLSFNGETEFTRYATDATVDSREKVWDLGLKVNWNRDHNTEFTIGGIRRWQLLDQPPTPELKSISYILLLSGALDLGHGFFTRAAIKDVLLRQSLDDDKTYVQAELGYENPQYYRVSVGYERIESQTDLYPDRYYRGNGVFVRLVGKM